jgi:hypothetical protein
LLAVLVSHPLAGLPSQLAKPALQLATVHMLPEHPDVAFDALHMRPQAPHAVTVLVRFTSHPLAGLPSQSAKPLVQAYIQLPPVQLAVALARAAQVRPQPPQCVTLLRVSTSQPSAATMLQSARPVVQVNPQVPIAQVVVAPARPGHTVPHAPHAATLLAMLVSHPLATFASQSARPMSHMLTEQLPPVQLAAPPMTVHTRPQPPQCEVLVRRSTSHPLAALPSQSAKPALHAYTQPPLVQLAVALALAAHARPQPPQCAVLLRVSTSQPSVAIMLQSARPVSQVKPQVPIVHVVVAPLRAGHAVPQPPQARRSVRVSVSHPLAGFMSQSARPVSHVLTVQLPAMQVPVPPAGRQARPHEPQ